MKSIVVEKPQELSELWSLIRYHFPEGLNNTVRLLIDLSSYEWDISAYTSLMVEYLLWSDLELTKDNIWIVRNEDNLLYVWFNGKKLSPVDTRIINLLLSDIGVYFTVSEIARDIKSKDKVVQFRLNALHALFKQQGSDIISIQNNRYAILDIEQYKNDIQIKKNLDEEKQALKENKKLRDQELVENQRKELAREEEIMIADDLKRKKEKESLRSKYWAIKIYKDRYVAFADETILLPKIGFKIFKYLTENIWEFVTFSDMCDEFWDIEESRLKGSMTMLVKKLKKHGLDCIDVSLDSTRLLDNELPISYWETFESKAQKRKRTSKTANKWASSRITSTPKKHVPQFQKASIPNTPGESISEIWELWGYEIENLRNNFFKISGVLIQFWPGEYELLKRLFIATIQAWEPILIPQWNKKNRKLRYFDSSYANRITSVFKNKNISMEVEFHEWYGFKLQPTN